MLPKHLDLATQPPGTHHRHGPLALTRRTFIAGATGAAIGATVLSPTAALARKRRVPPKPIPGGFTIEGITFHVFGFGPGMEPSTITDFNGFFGVCDVQGTGTATNPDGSTETLLFDTDMRFMQGTYIGVDGKVHQGSFGFV